MAPSPTGLLKTALLAAALALGAPASAREPEFPPSPAQIYGDLFRAVQLRRIFDDGKLFVDAIPRRPPAQILADYRAGDFRDDAALRAFVEANFILPETVATPQPTPGSAQRLSLTEHIARLWPMLTRPAINPPPGSSALALPEPYVVPGGRFREIYYWDSYFTMLGLERDGEDALLRAMLDNFESLIDRYGRIPNGTRTYYLGRSQPPFFALMAGLSGDPARHLEALRREHDFWMEGEEQARREGAVARVVAMPDGSILNRYWDDRNWPRDESYREDVETAVASGKPPEIVYRDLRAGAESGWDFSSRWLGDGRTLATIRTSAIVPADLNSLLWSLERTIAELCEGDGDQSCAREFRARADGRRSAILRYMWDAEAGRFADFDRRAGLRIDQTTAATLYPLFVGLATEAQARAVAATTAETLVAPGGLRTTTVDTGQQWDRPNGWAPLQWIAVAGLSNYGHKRLACTIAARWVATVAREYQASGRLLEKYDVEERRPGGGGEYPLQDGFGWTNGVTREMIARYPGLEVQGDATQREAAACHQPA